MTRKLAPTSRGAIQLGRQFGDALVCVRHRTDSTGVHRYTTVELVVGTSEIRRRAPDERVHIRIDWNDKNLRATVCAAGATWDPQLKLWCMSRKVATALQLTQKIVQPK